MRTKSVGLIRRIGQAFSYVWTGTQTTAPAVSLGQWIDAAMQNFSVATRENALMVPAVLRGRNMVCNISTLPLTLLDPQRRPTRDPLLDQIDPNVPNVVTLAQTVEDLQFDGVAWWQILTRGWNGYPTSAQHVDSRRVSVVPPTGWQNPLPSGIDPASVVWIDGQPVDGRTLIRFDSPNPPLLVAGQRVIRRAVLIEQAAEMYATDPRPLDYFTPSDSVGSLLDEEVQEVLDSWSSARRRRKTAFVPETLSYNSVQSPSPVDLQLVQLQARASLDIANAIGVDPEDLGVSTTSRTYQNATDRRQDRVNDVLSGFMRAITDRLSMADVIRRGYRVVFDLDDYMRADPTTRWGVYQTAKSIGVLDVKEIRAREDLPEISGNGPAPAPAPTPEEPDPAEEGTAVSAHNPPARLQFDAIPESTELQFDSDAMTFSVDAQRRVIKGDALIFGVEGSNADGRWKFASGSIGWKKSAVNRVKLLREHDWGSLLGSAMSVKESDGRLHTEFKVARGPAGDQALMEAEDGALDGLSVGIDITEVQPNDDGSYTVLAATLREVSLTPRPAFDDARLTSVAASRTRGTAMPEEKKEDNTLPTIDYDALASAFARLKLAVTPDDDGDQAPTPDPQTFDAPGTVNPVRPTPGMAPSSFVREPLPYQFDRGGNFTRGEYDFSTDVVSMLKAGDNAGTNTDAGKRAMAVLRSAFVASGDVDELNPTRNMPERYVDEKAYRTPLWDIINQGAPPNGVQPFGFPKFSAASGLVDDHTEGVEPTSGSFTTTSQTITPTALSGKASLTREVWDMGGNPAISTLVYNKMVQKYRLGLESATATFLATLTAAADITLTTAAADGALAAEVEAAITALQFEATYDWSAFALEKVLYTALAAATDDTGRPLYPQIAPSNANGTAARRFRTLDIGGVTGFPAWALASTAGSSNSSWLFDPSVVHGWATTPQRLEFAGTSAATTEDPKGSYAPVAMIDIAVWGYKAFANSDIGGVRQVTYDSAA